MNSTMMETGPAAASPARPARSRNNKARQVNGNGSPVSTPNTPTKTPTKNSSKTRTPKSARKLQAQPSNQLAPSPPNSAPPDLDRTNSHACPSDAYPDPASLPMPNFELLRRARRASPLAAGGSPPTPARSLALFDEPHAPSTSSKAGDKTHFMSLFSKAASASTSARSPPSLGSSPPLSSSVPSDFPHLNHTATQPAAGATIPSSASTSQIGFAAPDHASASMRLLALVKPTSS
ncbi:uncharacterized protein MONBRDRAFT_11465 [Monosiga brevicollis MX1]|uniref:Uncharacterized protein n=1 Tax=Monosiga brevicollis TaxID=81824 RepID=A9V979_MONBE|nr:uncharacterized protein MONBRDRAFT_11465 [Monosiga brevicollis MX1]EDQ85813.1 predicted protein [Monosiga brevicollis MX1]|eukprot:XP_001749292.1 hypothetical protein [Monosiga brevicollis MX1]